MIVSPQTGKQKNIDRLDDPYEPRIFFLKQDGSLIEESFELTDRGYISKKDGDCFGKVETTNSIKKFYLKQWRGGRPGEILVDPYGHFWNSDNLSAYAQHRGERFCEYSQIKEELFYTYIQYLQSRNPIFFRFVERIILNGESL